jgi:hypothetical protein
VGVINEEARQPKQCNLRQNCQYDCTAVCHPAKKLLELSVFHWHSVMAISGVFNSSQMKLHRSSIRELSNASRNTLGGSVKARLNNNCSGSFVFCLEEI